MPYFKISIELDKELQANRSFRDRITEPLILKFDLIFVNGGNNLENLKTGEEKWKMWIIEEEFKKSIFQKLGMSENVRFDSKTRRIPEA